MALAAAVGLAACSSVRAPAPTAAERSASPILDRIKQRGEIVIGTSGSQPPLILADKSGALIGLEADLARLIAMSMGVKEKMLVLPFSELLPALHDGKVDVVISGMTMTPERNMKVAFVGPYFVSGTSVLTRSALVDSMSEASKVDDPETRLAALRGSTSQRIVEELAPKATLTLVDDYDDAVDKIIRRDIDALVADQLFCILAALRHRDSGLTTLVRPLTFEPMGIALPANDALLINWMENFFLTLDGTGVLADITERWLNDPAWLDDANDRSLP
jgi:polar amino acid transport system substrate-binding protein